MRSNEMRASRSRAEVILEIISRNEMTRRGGSNAGFAGTRVSQRLTACTSADGGWGANRAGSAGGQAMASPRPNAPDPFRCRTPSSSAAAFTALYASNCVTRSISSGSSNGFSGRGSRARDFSTERRPATSTNSAIASGASASSAARCSRNWSKTASSETSLIAS
jgi:hypothetical protein